MATSVAGRAFGLMLARCCRLGAGLTPRLLILYGFGGVERTLLYAPKINTELSAGTRPPRASTGVEI
jgi:hypothetical protein